MVRCTCTYSVYFCSHMWQNATHQPKLNWVLPCTMHPAYTETTLMCDDAFSICVHFNLNDYYYYFGGGRQKLVHIKY